MEDSILVSIKKLTGLDSEDKSFDTDLIIHINSAFDVLHQLGVGPDEGFYINDESAIWEDYLPESQNLRLVKSYVYMKVRKWFDPPQNGTTMEALNSSIAELEWRLNVTVDPSSEASDV